MEFQIIDIFETILHIACESGNLELVKYIISLNIIDINSKTVFLPSKFYDVYLVFNKVFF